MIDESRFSYVDKSLLVPEPLKLNIAIINLSSYQKWATGVEIFTHLQDLSVKSFNHSTCCYVSRSYK